MSSPQQQNPELTLVLALTPIIFLISLLACSVYLFSADSSCGAYMSTTLGVATISYAPFAFFNLFCPVIAIIYGFANIALKPAQAEAKRTLTGQT